LKRLADEKKASLYKVSFEKNNYESFSNINQNINQIRQDIDEIFHKLIDFSQTVHGNN